MPLPMMVLQMMSLQMMSLGLPLSFFLAMVRAFSAAY
jgi:hypothetical protein